MSDMFDKKQAYQLFEIMHKWFEVGIGAKFYSSTKFKPPEFIQEGRNYAWILRK
jgi:hypothetical protein